MSEEKRFDRIVILFMIIFFFLFWIVKLFNIGWFYIGFVVFGVPIIVVTTIFWYDVIIKLFNI